MNHKLLLSVLTAVLLLVVLLAAVNAQQPAHDSGREVPPTFEDTGPAAPLDVTTLSAVADAYVDSATPTQNYGSVTPLYVGNQTPSAIDRALFRFDLTTLPPGAIIDNATLRVYMSQAPSGPPLVVDIGAYRITTSWTETGIAWGNQPSVLPIGQITGVSMTLQTYEWEVTNLAQDWLANPATNFGVALRSEIEGTVGWRGFASREAAVASRPQLVIEHHLPPCTDAQEPNDTFAQAFLITSSVEYTGCIPTPSDLDYFRFDVSPNTAIQVELYSLPANYDLYLYAPDQSLLDSSVNVGTTSEMVAYTTGPAGGQFYAQVQSDGEWDLYNPYALKLTLTPVMLWPDLVVNDVWSQGSQVCYEIENIGQATAPQGHYTSLTVDSVLSATHVVTEDLAPGAQMEGCFGYQWQCTVPQDEIAVCADHGADVAESNTANNCTEETWPCDTTPPAINAVADAYLDSTNPITNYGAAPSLYVGAQSANQEEQALVWFDLSPLNGVTVQTATLELYLSGGSSSPETLSMCVDRILENWDEMNVNWATQPSHATLDNCNLVGGDIAYYDWDVTGLVQEWVDGTYPNYGLLLRAESETTIGWRSFNSREVSTNRPRLVISYTATLDTDDPQLQGLRRLEANSTVPVRGRFRNGIPAYVHAKVPVSGTPGNPLLQARAFLDAYKDLYRLTDATTQFRLSRRKIDGFASHIFLQQMHDGVPVYGAELGVHIENGLFSSSSGAYLPALDLSVVPNVTQHSAEQAATAHVLSATPDISVTVVGKTALVVFDPSLWTNATPDPRLAWLVNVRSNQQEWTYFVDAQTGNILHRLDRDRNLHLSIYTANNDNSGDCWERDDPSTQWYDEHGAIVPGHEIDMDGQNANVYIRWTHRYYADVGRFDRQSYDDDDGWIRLYVNTLITPTNARWRPCGDLMEYSPGWVAQDVVGHEFTHGVINHEFNPPSGGESGALEESLADTFGAFIEAYAEGAPDDWLIGEDRAGGAMRNMANPPDFGRTCPENGVEYAHPDHYDDYHDDMPCDNGGVHTNNGILNKAAWLISSDTDNTHYGFPVHGLTITRAEQIFYEAVTNRLPRSSEFINMREEMIESAEALYGAASDEVCTVRNAYAAVGLGIADTDCDGDENPVDPDNDNDFINDPFDNCPLIANPGQKDTDDDRRGDACDPDDDNDFHDDVIDNCPLIANPSQLDTDHDGIGEACDDQDYDDEGNPKPDGIPNRHGDDSLWDNCPDVWNPDQANHDGDNQGDACDTDDDNDGILDDGDHSGEAGDHYCTCGNNWLCDDNAPFDQNHDQKDDDCDGVGDVDDVGNVIDNCLDTYNPYVAGIYPPVQPDNDQDDEGDVCDDDDDDDGVPDTTDNCQYHINPHQIDIDRNGIGLTCDWDEAFMLSADAQQVAFFIQFGDMSPVILPIFPCWADGCPDENSVLPEGQRAYVSLTMPEGFGVRISDDVGSLVKRDHTDLLNKALSFPVHPSYRFDFGAMSLGAMDTGARRTTSVSETVRYAQRPLYYLELWPAADTVVGQTYTVQFDLVSFAPTDWVYLPIVVR